MKIILLALAGFWLAIALLLGVLFWPPRAALPQTQTLHNVPAQAPSVALPSAGPREENPTVVGDPNITQPAPASQARATPQAANAPLFADDQKQQAYEALKQAKEDLASVPPPQISGLTDPTSVSSSINSFVDQMGKRAQAYSAARDHLRQQLSPDEEARLHQELEGQ